MEQVLYALFFGIRYTGMLKGLELSGIVLEYWVGGGSPLLFTRVLKAPAGMFCPYVKLHTGAGMSVWLTERIKAE